MDKAISTSHNDKVFPSWVYDQKIRDCLGFVVNRADPVARRTPLPASVGFKGSNNTDWVHQDTAGRSVRKFSLRDFSAKRSATHTREIVAVILSADTLLPDLPRHITDHVTLRPKRSFFPVCVTKAISTGPMRPVLVS